MAETSSWHWSCNKNTSPVTPSESPLLQSSTQLSPHIKYTGSLENRSEEAWKTSISSREQEQLWDQSRLLGHFPVRPWRSPRLHSLCGWPLLPFFTVVLPYTDMNLLFQLQPGTSHAPAMNSGEESGSISLESSSQTEGCCLVLPNLCSGLSQPKPLSLHHSPSWRPLAKLTSQTPHCFIACHIKTKKSPPKTLNTQHTAPRC